MRNGLSRFFLGLLVSLGLHAALVLAVWSFLSSRDARNGTLDSQIEPPRLEIASVDLSFADDVVEEAPENAAQPIPPPTESPEPPRMTPRAIEPPPLLAPDDSPVSVEMRQVDVQVTKAQPRDLDAPDTPAEEYPVVEAPKVETPVVDRSVAEKPLVDEPAVPAAPAPRQARVNAAPSPRKTIRPQYPTGARKRREQGDVTLELSVDAHGVVVDVKVVASCGFAELEQAAIAAARKALFRPAKQGDESVASLARLTLSFKLRD